MACLFVSAGSEVTIVQDGQLCHHSKRATIERAAMHEKSRIHSLKAHCQLMYLSEELNNCGIGNISERENLQEKIQACERTVSTGTSSAFRL